MQLAIFHVVSSSPHCEKNFAKGIICVAVHDIGSRASAAIVHTHVERGIRTERKSALRRVEMVRRDAQIGQYAVDTVDASAAQCAAHEAEVGLDEREALVVGGVDARVGIPDPSE